VNFVKQGKEICPSKNDEVAHALVASLLLASLFEPPVPLKKTSS